VPPPEDEPPTKPDRKLMTCPSCHGEGTVLVLVKHVVGRHTSVRRQCGVCFGRLLVDRVAYERAIESLKSAPPSR
jgi:transcription elongation factor Elf1